MSHGEAAYVTYHWSKVPDAPDGSFEKAWIAETNDEKMSWESAAAAAIYNARNAPVTPDL